jgi:two-component system, OmpR family, osmolarity sensor histidine kinase EnvZ
MLGLSRIRTLPARLILTSLALTTVGYVGLNVLMLLQREDDVSEQLAHAVALYVLSLQAQSPTTEPLTLDAKLTALGFQLRPERAGEAPPAAEFILPRAQRMLTALQNKLSPQHAVRGVSRQWATFEVAVQRGADRYWLRFPPGTLAQGGQRGLVFGLTYIALILALSMFITYWLVRQPFRALRDMVAQQTLTPEPVTLPASHPEEAHAIARALNTWIARLRGNEQERAVMLAGLAHDLRAPLARMRVRSEFIAKPAAQTAMIDDIDAMTRLTDEFIAFATPIPARAATAADVRTRLQRVADHHRNMGLDVRLDAANTTMQTTVPLLAIERIANNLIDNALHYGRAPITVRLQQQAEQCTLSVHDCGNGMDAEAFARACQPFVRLDVARGGKGHSGLGLAVVDRILRGYGGELRCERGEAGGFVVQAVWSAL